MGLKCLAVKRQSLFDAMYSYQRILIIVMFETETSKFASFFFRETNLKVRQAIPETAALGENIGLLSKFNGMFSMRCQLGHIQMLIFLVQYSCLCLVI